MKSEVFIILSLSLSLPLPDYKSMAHQSLMYLDEQDSRLCVPCEMKATWSVYKLLA